MKGYSYVFFVHCFMMIEWNLLAREDIFVDVILNHIEWIGDSLVFYFENSEVYQHGERQHQPWNVY